MNPYNIASVIYFVAFLARAAGVSRGPAAYAPQQSGDFNDTVEDDGDEPQYRSTPMSYLNTQLQGSIPLSQRPSSISQNLSSPGSLQWYDSSPGSYTPSQLQSPSSLLSSPTDNITGASGTQPKTSSTQQLRQELPASSAADIDSVARRIAASSIDAVATLKVCMWLPGLNGPLATEIYREKQHELTRVNKGEFSDTDKIAAQADTKNLVFLHSIAECVNILGSDVAGDYFFTAQGHPPHVENEQENAVPAGNAPKRLVPGHTYYAAAEMSEHEENELVKPKLGFVEILTKRSQSNDTPELCHVFLRCPDYCWETTINKCSVPKLLGNNQNDQPQGRQSKDIPIMLPMNVFRSDNLNNPNNRTCTVRIDEYGNIVLRYRYSDATINVRIFHKQNVDMNETLHRVRTNCARYAFTEYDPEQRVPEGIFAALHAKAEVLAKQPPASVDLEAHEKHVQNWMSGKESPRYKQPSFKVVVTPENALSSLQEHDIAEAMNILCSSYARDYFFEVVPTILRIPERQHTYFALAEMCVADNGGNAGKSILKCSRGMIEFGMEDPHRDSNGNPWGRDKLQHMRFQPLSSLLNRKVNRTRSDSAKKKVTLSEDPILTHGTPIVSAEHIFKQDALRERECELKLSTSGNVVLNYYEFVESDGRKLRKLTKTLKIIHKKVRLEKLDMAEIEDYSEAIVKSLEIVRQKTVIGVARKQDVQNPDELNDLTCLLGGWDIVVARHARRHADHGTRNSAFASNIPRSYTNDHNVQDDPECTMLLRSV